MRVPFDVDLSKGTLTRFSIVEKRCVCPHPHFALNEQERTVTCQDCGKTVDPFDALLSFANEERRLAYREKKARRALDEFERIKSEWSLTQAEKRRLNKAMEGRH